MSYDTAITILGLLAATATIVQSTIGLGGQLLRLRTSSEIEIRGVDVRVFLLNSISHSIWALWALGTSNMIVLAPNLAGGAISAAIVFRILKIRNSYSVAQVLGSVK